MENNTGISQKLLEALLRLKRIHPRNLPPINGLNHSEVVVLFAIKHIINVGQVGVKVSEISKHMRLTMPTITPVINKLMVNGHVQKCTDAEDRRAVRVNLTPKGEEVIIEAKESFTGFLNGLIEYMGEEKVNNFIEYLNEINAYLNENFMKS